MQVPGEEAAFTVADSAAAVKVQAPLAEKVMAPRSPDCRVDEIVVVLPVETLEDPAEIERVPDFR